MEGNQANQAKETTKMIKQTIPVGTIEVQATSEGFTVYGRMGAMMKADKNKEITYCNLNETADEYKRMIKKLNKA